MRLVSITMVLSLGFAGLAVTETAAATSFMYAGSQFESVGKCVAAPVHKTECSTAAKAGGRFAYGGKKFASVRDCDASPVHRAECLAASK